MWCNSSQKNNYNLPMKYEKLVSPGETELSVKIKEESGRLEIIKSLNNELTIERQEGEGGVWESNRENWERW